MTTDPKNKVCLLNRSQKQISSIISTLQSATKKYQLPLVDLIVKEFGHDPFLILISCLLSLRAKDIVTIHVCKDLFAIAKTPEEILDLHKEELEKIIFRTGFYKNKARTLKWVSKEILERFKGRVPKTKEELLSIKGVGEKTANLVLGMAYNIPAICVDTHVHRISNRLGIIKTKDVIQTERALEKVIPKENWVEWNKLLVIWGQNVCVPISPFCSKCEINPFCEKVGVKKSR